MLIEWIEKTRKKPKAVRNQYAFLGATVFTAAVFLVWLITLPTQLAQIQEADAEDSTEAKSAFGDFFKDAKEQFASVIQNAGNNIEEEETAEEVENAPSVVMPEISQEKAAQIERTYELKNNIDDRKTVLIATSSSQKAKQIDNTNESLSE